MSHIYDNMNFSKALRIHRKVAAAIEPLDPFMRRKILGLFGLLQSGANLGLPISRPMPVIAPGAHELRLKDAAGQIRIFYYTKQEDYILIFHFLRKKTQKTPPQELSLARKRLEEML